MKKTITNVSDKIKRHKDSAEHKATNKEKEFYQDKVPPNDFILCDKLQKPRKRGDTSYLRAVAKDIVRWARTDGSLTLEAFYDMIDMTDDSVEDWCKKQKFLHNAVQKAKRIIGVRREVGLITRRYDRYVASTLHNYLPRCRSTDAYQAKLKQLAAESSTDVDLVKRIFADVQKVISITRVPTPETKPKSAKPAPTEGIGTVEVQPEEPSSTV